MGADIPTLPHWLHPSIGIMGRTNVIGRVRTRGGFRTGVFVANASGNLNYGMTGAGRDLRPSIMTAIGSAIC